jgi:putative glutamine amidotransferase
MANTSGKTFTEECNPRVVKASRLEMGYNLEDFIIGADMAFPLIGVTTAHTPNKTDLPSITVNEAYTQALWQSGAAPVMIPLGLPDDILRDVLTRLDGILFTGGGDVETQRYSGEDHPHVGDVDADRDRVEILLVEEVAQRGIPFMGICRGIQVINVALGGTLYSDIAAQHPGALKHDYYPDWPRDHPAHVVEILAGSRLSHILGETQLEVNSLHHQALRQPAPGLRVLAHAPDGIVEAVELPENPFGLAIQWHPEWLQEHEPMRNLFRAFIEAAKRMA